MNAVAKVEQPAKMMLLAYMADKYALNPDEFAKTVRMTCGLPKATPEEFAAFLIVAKEYNLNPLTKEIYAFPGKGGGIVPIVSIDGWVNLVNSHRACDGFEFEMEHAEDGELVSCTCRMFRKDRSHPIAVTEYLSECIRNTEPWKMRHRMLRHKAMIQAARYAFGFSGIYDEDEAARFADMRDVSPRRAAEDDGPPPPPAISHQPRDAMPPIVPADRDLEMVESGRSEPGEVIWDDFPPAPDPLEIPRDLDRRGKPQAIEATAADIFDAAQWLRDLEGALSGCEDFASLGDVQAKMIVPHKGKAFPPDMSKATKLFNDHVVRLQGIMSAG